MKNILITIFLLASIILLQSCTPKPIFYDSEAGLPYIHESTKTVFHLITDDSTTTNFPFCIIAAKDNDTLSYVLFAPSKYYSSAKDLTDAYLDHAIPLLPNQVKEFIKILNSSAVMWNTKFDFKDGISYEFRIAPEQNIIQRSENVVTWFPILQFYFQNNHEGPLCSIFVGERPLKYDYKIRKFSEIKYLIKLLELALKHLKINV